MTTQLSSSRELQLTLTARDRERNQPMCGVPYHAVEGYLARLLRKGYRIAICDQMEDPKLTKKIVRREVTRVLSPGTALDNSLGQEQNNFLAALFEAGGFTGRSNPGPKQNNADFQPLRATADSRPQAATEQNRIHHPERAALIKAHASQLLCLTCPQANFEPRSFRAPIRSLWPSTLSSCPAQAK